MSGTAPDSDADLEDLDLPAPICEFCGPPIDERGQQCYARDDGEVCQP